VGDVIDTAAGEDMAEVRGGVGVVLDEEDAP
jgi:hypothetical protein